MLTVAAIYTPQAASTVAMIVPTRERASAIAFVFLGWSLAVAGGLPMITFIAAYAGWRCGVCRSAALAALVAVLCCWRSRCRAGLRGPPLSLASFGTIARNIAKSVAVLLITILQTSGQFTVFIYLVAALDTADRRRSRQRGRDDVRHLWRGRICRQCHRHARSCRRSAAEVTSALFLGSTFTRHDAVVARRRLPAGDGHRHCLLGARLCRHQLHAAGAAGGGRARSHPAPRSGSTLGRFTPGRRSAPASAAYCSPRLICTASAMSARLRGARPWRWWRRPGSGSRAMRSARLNARDQALDLRQHARDDDGIALRVVMRVVARAVFSGGKIHCA